MIAWWIAQIAVMGGLLAAAAYGTESALRAARKPTRWAWVGALVMTLALALLAPMRVMREAAPVRALPAKVVMTELTTTPASTDAFSQLRAAWQALATNGSTQVQRAWGAWHDVMPADVDRWMLVAWASASAAMLLLFAGVHWRYQRRRRQWPLGSVHGTTVRIASDTGPAVIGVTSAEIVVPQWLLGRDAREQQLVIAHELEHVRLHDPLLLAVAQAVVVLLPWHPAVWWMAARLRLAVELDCDRRVLQRGASARDYGTLLIDLTDHRTGFGAALPAFSCSPSNLERRLVAMTPKPMRYPLVRALTTGALASLALLAACEANLPTSAEMDRMTASTATSALGKVAMVDTGALAYYVNDIVTTKAAAEAIPADSIMTVNVAKTTSGGGEVRIVTRQAGDAPSGMKRKMEVDTLVIVADSIVMTRPGSEPRMISERKRTFDGLMVVDDVITDPAVANGIAPDQIVSVNVIKGEAAAQLYKDPRAAKGVIKIVTKKSAKP